MNLEFFVPGPLPGLNELNHANSRTVFRGGKRFPAYALLKSEWQGVVIAAARAAKIGVFGYSQVFFHFNWMERDKRRDPDNFVAGGKKIILDGLVKGGFLKNDGWQNVKGWDDRWDVFPKRPGVNVKIQIIG